MLARFIFGPKEVDKERRLNRQARRYDPQHRFKPLQRFVPSDEHNCQDPRHDLLHAGALLPPRRPHLAAGMKYPMMAFRRKRGGGWGWVPLYRPDGLPMVPHDAPIVPGFDPWDAHDPRLPQRLQHGLECLPRNIHPLHPLAARRCDDEWEHISSPDEPRYPRGLRRRPSFHRRRPVGAFQHGHGDSIDGHHRRHRHHHLHHHHGGHHHRPHPRHHIGPPSLFEDRQISERLSQRGGAGLNRHDLERLGLRHGHPMGPQSSDGGTADYDDDLWYYDDEYDDDDDDDDDEDVYSNAETSTRSSW